MIGELKKINNQNKIIKDADIKSLEILKEWNIK
jgi:hypothetical protein